MGDQILAVVGYYLALLPLFTLSTIYIVHAITLRENLKALVSVLLKRWRGKAPFHWAINRLVFPVFAIVPALSLATGVQDVKILLGVFGSYPGIFSQYVIPASLAFAGKYIITKRLNMKYNNRYRFHSAFCSSWCWC